MQKFLILFTVFSLPGVMFAQITFTEIAYDPVGADTGREWVEVRNSGTESIDLTTWKLFEAGINHGINEFQGGKIVSVGGIAIIADNAEKFLLDFPDYSGLLFDSAFSLSNAGETLIMRNMGVDIDSVTYTSGWGANGDGNSLQLKGGEWISVTPTPGYMIPEDPIVVDEELHEYISVPVGSGKFDFPVVLVREVFAGTLVHFVAKGNKKFEKHSWHFGVGDSVEGSDISRTYDAVGDFELELRSYKNETYTTTRMIIRVN